MGDSQVFEVRTECIDIQLFCKDNFDTDYYYISHASSLEFEVINSAD